MNNSLAVLESLKDLDTSAHYCHGFAHKIAQAEVAKDPDNWINLFEKLDLQDCTRGYFHGVIEAHTGFDPEFRLTPETINSICQKVGEVSSQFPTATQGDLFCSHAIGHTLLVQEKGNIPQTIEICSTIKESLRYECYSGTFMENMNRENLVLHGILPPFPWNEENTRIQEKICMEYESDAASACWQAMGHMYALLADKSNNVEFLYNSCQKAPTAYDKDKCYLNGVGFHAFFQINQNRELRNIFKLCDPYSKGDDSYQECIRLTVHYIIFSEPTYANRVNFYCDDLEKPFAEYCTNQIRRKIQAMYTPQEIQNMCRKYPEELEVLCKRKS